MDRMMEEMDKNISEGKSDPTKHFERQLASEEPKGPSCPVPMKYVEPTSEPTSREE